LGIGQVLPAGYRPQPAPRINRTSKLFFMFLPPFRSAEWSESYRKPENIGKVLRFRKIQKRPLNHYGCVKPNPAVPIHHKFVMKIGTMPLPSKIEVRVGMWCGKSGLPPWLPIPLFLGSGSIKHNKIEKFRIRRIFFIYLTNTSFSLFRKRLTISCTSFRALAKRPLTLSIEQCKISPISEYSSPSDSLRIKISL